MFKWQVEDMVLRQQKGGIFIGKEKIYDCESDVSREDKIAFVDEMQDGKLSYILALAEKFETDKDSMPKDSWGNVKTVSLKAWIKRNDDRRILDNSYRYGDIRFLEGRNIQSINLKGSYSTYEDYVDEVFHRQLIACERMEESYFLEHDEYSILKSQFRNRKHDTTFGVRIGQWSNGKICIVNEDEGNRQEREITIEELKDLLAKYEQLDKLVEKLTEETNITF